MNMSLIPATLNALQPGHVLTIILHSSDPDDGDAGRELLAIVREVDREVVDDPEEGGTMRVARTALVDLTVPASSTDPGGPFRRWSVGVLDAGEHDEPAPLVLVDGGVTGDTIDGDMHAVRALYIGSIG